MLRIQAKVADVNGAAMFGTAHALPNGEWLVEGDRGERVVFDQWELDNLFNVIAEVQ